VTNRCRLQQNVSHTMVPGMIVLNVQCKGSRVQTLEWDKCDILAMSGRDVNPWASGVLSINMHCSRVEMVLSSSHSSGEGN
jgi:hypothetical protein